MIVFKIFGNYNYRIFNSYKSKILNNCIDKKLYLLKYIKNL